MVGQQSADMHFNDAALENIIAKLVEHLRLRGMNHIAEIHIIGHAPFKGHFHRFRYGHGRLTGSQSQRHRAAIGAKSHTL